MAEYVNPTKNVRKKTCFRVKTGLFTHPFGGDKRDRTADLLNAIGSLRYIYSPYSSNSSI